jgi:hypothetical protein
MVITTFEFFSYSSLSHLQHKLISFASYSFFYNFIQYRHSMIGKMLADVDSASSSNGKDNTQGNSSGCWNFDSV